MSWFDKVKMYYDEGLWDVERVKDAVVMGKITKAQFAKITTQNYVT